MLFKKYVSQASNMFTANRLFKFLIICLVIINIFLVYNYKQLATHTRTILIPPGLDRKVSIQDNYIDKHYLTAMGVYISNLLYEFKVEDVVSQYEAFTDLMSAEFYNQYNKEILLEASNYETNEVSQDITIQSIGVRYEPNSMIYVDMEISKYVTDTLEDTYKQGFEIFFEIKNGLFRVTNIKEVQYGQHFIGKK